MRLILTCQCQLSPTSKLFTILALLNLLTVSQARTSLRLDSGTRFNIPALSDVDESVLDVSGVDVLL